jgi:nucleoside-diphosphate kinase
MKHLLFIVFVTVVIQLDISAQNGNSDSFQQIEITTQVQPSKSDNSSAADGANYQPKDSGTIDHTIAQKMEQTLSIIKPNAVRNRHTGDILLSLENKGLHIVGMKMVELTPQQAAQFYQVHQNRPFFQDLVTFMSSGPIVVVVLEGTNAIAKNREIMGATNPAEADEGTIRAKFGTSITENAIHGSDSPETAREEIQFFFQKDQIFPDLHK